MFANSRHGLRLIHRLLIRYSLVLSAAGIVVGWALRSGLGSVFLREFPEDLLWLTVAALPASVYANFWNGYMVGLGRLSESNRVQVVASVTWLVLNVVLVGLLKGGLVAALTVYVLVGFGQAFVMAIIAARPTGTEPEGTEARGLGAAELVRFGLRAYWGSLSTLLWTRSSTFLLNAYHGPWTVGIFSVAQQLAEKLTLPSLALQDVLFPRVAAVERPEAAPMLNRCLRLMLWGMIPPTFLLSMLAGPLIEEIFGEAYAKAAAPFRLLLAGAVAMSLPPLLVPYFLVQLRRPGLLSVLAWVNVLISVALAVVLVPRYAAFGAALSLSLTQIVGTLIVIAIYLRAARTSASDVSWPKREDVKRVVTAIGLLGPRRSE